MKKFVDIEFKPDVAKITSKLQDGKQAMTIAVTEAVVQYGNEYVRIDQGTMRDSSLIYSRPNDGLAIWNTPYAKKTYYTGTPSKDVNPKASLMWVEKGVKAHAADIDKIAQKSFSKGMRK